VCIASGIFPGRIVALPPTRKKILRIFLRGPPQKGVDPSTPLNERLALAFGSRCYLAPSDYRIFARRFDDIENGERLCAGATLETGVKMNALPPILINHELLGMIDSFLQRKISSA
jgi:hypothetical protein